MTAPAAPAEAADLAEARAQFNTWRSTRAAGGRIPDHLWSLAIALLSSHSATEVARQLGLHPERLRRRHAEMARPDRSPRKPRGPRTRRAAPAFLEIAPDALVTHAHRTRGDLRLVIECSDGTRISLASASSDWTRVEALVRSLVAR
jgi:hypothetical protein